jgi:hypothetical protein
MRLTADELLLGAGMRARARWLRYSALYAEVRLPVPEMLFASGAPDFCFEQFQSVAPVQQWLVDVLPE